MDCIFCKIAQKKMPSKIVYEDDIAVAFEDINPQAPIHLIIIPHKHIPTILDMDESDKAIVGHLHTIAGKLARERNIAERGFRLVLNCNKEAGQTVFHIHLHLIGGRIMRWPPG